MKLKLCQRHKVIKHAATGNNVCNLSFNMLVFIIPPTLIAISPHDKAVFRRWHN